ncbi:ribonuclease III [Helicobacter fennelliae]|uniref:Ribonuclease 3 n=1 Tax=Helicobacter fennelliae TaxID=215 RepID=A0A2X3DGM7_9HELI|nr:ribonuclease III [Helicobacter fennelliae]SQB98559.1 ribonuclease III [Helicobacter fennelliae]
MDSITRFQNNINYHFKNKQLLIEALTHRSAKKHNANKHNNERLEFLGDAVLDLIIGEYLFCKFPQHNEGKLSKMRSSLVNEESFAKIARNIHIGDILILSQSEEQNNGRNKNSLLSDAFEAIMGALYLEAGIEKVKEIIYKLLDTLYPNMNMDNLFMDYKTALQEITQARFGSIPVYKLIDEKGPDHDKKFAMQILIEDIIYATAIGNSKKNAQQSCAKIAYLKITKQEDNQ